MRILLTTLTLVSLTVLSGCSSRLQVQPTKLECPVGPQELYIVPPALEPPAVAVNADLLSSYLELVEAYNLCRQRYSTLVEWLNFMEK